MIAPIGNSRCHDLWRIGLLPWHSKAAIRRAGMLETAYPCGVQPCCHEIKQIGCTVAFPYSGFNLFARWRSFNRTDLAGSLSIPVGSIVSPSTRVVGFSVSSPAIHIVSDNISAPAKNQLAALQMRVRVSVILAGTLVLSALFFVAGFYVVVPLASAFLRDAPLISRLALSVHHLVMNPPFSDRGGTV